VVVSAPDTAIFLGLNEQQFVTVKDGSELELPPMIESLTANREPG